MHVCMNFQDWAALLTKSLLLLETVRPLAGNFDWSAAGGAAAFAGEAAAAAGAAGTAAAAAGAAAAALAAGGRFSLRRSTPHLKQRCSSHSLHS